MRALILSWEYPPIVEGGLARHVRKLSEGLVREGIEVHVITRGGARSAAREERHGVHVHRIAEPEIPGDLRVDVVVDPVGGELFEAALGRLRPLGQLVAIGYAGGLWPELQPAQLVGRNVGVQGVYIGRLLRHAPDVIAAATRELLELWSSRRIRPVVGAEFPLADVEQAHELVESRRSVGKAPWRTAPDWAMWVNTDGTENHWVRRLARTNCASLCGSRLTSGGTRCSSAPAARVPNTSYVDRSKWSGEWPEWRSPAAGPK